MRSCRATPGCPRASCSTPNATASRLTKSCKVGEAGYVGGQEDMIIDIALQLAHS
ncbi:hypothetical protein [Rhodococcus ruber]|uniref:hypothetical protein n=1 Tax=Rhodococcus ruber TaxID=1830 RepID=UPI003D2A34FA